MVCDEHAPFFDFEFAIKFKIKDCQDCLAQFLYSCRPTRVQELRQAILAIFNFKFYGKFKIKEWSVFITHHGCET